MKKRPLQTRIIYGPIRSRRLGRSLGVNILPTVRKVCSFDCVYCQYGLTPYKYNLAEARKLDLPSPGEVAESLQEALPQMGELDAITLAGNGEPTLHPSFAEIVEVVATLRDRYRPGVPLCVLSNSSTVEDPTVRSALDRIDRKIMKLDAGTQATFQLVNRPRPEVTLEKTVEGLVKIKPVEIQSLFFEGSLTNTTGREIEAWIEQLVRIDPLAVQIYTFDRIPADRSLQPLSRQALSEIARALGSHLPAAQVEVF